MRYFEVFPADSKYHGKTALTYSFEEKLPPLSVVSIPLQKQEVIGFVLAEVSKPSFTVKPISHRLSKNSLPRHCLQLAKWLSGYYATNMSEALGQFAPTKSTALRKPLEPTTEDLSLELSQPLTSEQTAAIKAISDNPSTTVLLHGETGSGKTRVYMELAKHSLAERKSVIILTPEISLTSQLYVIAQQNLSAKIFVLHSQLIPASRRKIWFEMLESTEPVVVIGARSALFAPLQHIGLMVVDEAHEPAYKQDQSPRYHTPRVASQLGKETGAKVLLATATPSVVDYYLASQKSAIVRMTQLASGKSKKISTLVIDLKNRENLGLDNYLSRQLIDAIKSTISAKKQVILYLNRRGSARLILCNVCGWTFYCPNCDIPLTFHADHHLARCHTCGFQKSPPPSCPTCNNPDIIYKSAGTKAIVETVKKLFPDLRVARFDSDSLKGERLNELYEDLLSGKIDILVGTQLLAKGLDLPRLGLVGVVNAVASLSLPDFTAEERAFQLLYQVVGRVGRGHTEGKVIIQTYDPTNIVISSALNRDWQGFYQHCLTERQQFSFPPFTYLLKLSCRRVSEKSALNDCGKLKKIITEVDLPVEVIGPAPAFYARRGKYYYYQLIVKSRERKYLLQIAEQAPVDWRVDIDPSNLL